MGEFRVLIADDEELARHRIRDLMAEHTEFKIIGEASDGAEAVTMIREIEPDLVILDVQMPHLNGFEVVSRVGVDHMPAVVFATAYDSYALQAFESNALDYLLKPIGAERLAVAIGRARSRIAQPAQERLDPKFVEWLARYSSPSTAYRERISIREGSHLTPVRVADLIWIEGADNYLRLHVSSGKSYMLRSRMRDFEQTLNPRHFARVHRSAIINVDAVERIESWGLGEYLFLMRGGTKVPSSRRYKDVIRDVFGC
jgi:two-component system LytT family response regulator